MTFNNRIKCGTFLGLSLFLTMLTTPLMAKLKVLATTSNLHQLVLTVGGDQVEAILLCKPNLDPHFIEAKPSFIMNASNADLVVAVGLDLEIGWLPKIIINSRNANIERGKLGYLEVGPLLEPLDVRHDGVTRADGDVHPEGNPHVTLDPLRLGKAALVIAERLGQLLPAEAGLFKIRAQQLKTHLDQKTEEWRQRIAASKHTEVITYHKSFTYFFSQFKIANATVLEPIPGVPPGAKHILQVIDKAKAQKVRLILVESYHDPASAEAVAKAVTGLKVATVPIEVGAVAGVETIDQMFEAIVAAF